MHCFILNHEINNLENNLCPRYKIFRHKRLKSCVMPLKRERGFFSDLGCKWKHYN